MTISIYTPSHDPRFLDEAYTSLEAQPYLDWEWVVLLNGEARWTPPGDDRVRVYGDDAVSGVGDAKRRAVERATGDVLVELDHDDVLAPDALHLLSTTLKSCEFAYSDFAQITEYGGYCADKFDIENGWQYHDETVYERDVLVCESLEQTPHNASYIWFEPNHVKAFTRSLYDKAGGYSTRDILDDQDLMCRMYQHTEFTRVPECLYLQRMHPGNTQRQEETNQRIQRETIELYDSYVQANALAWADRHHLEALDMGGAHNSPPGYATVDLEGDVDYQGDALTVLRAMPDSSVGVIRAVDFLEHLADPISFMNEAYRALAHGGLLLSLTPSTDGRGAFCDPTHIAFWNELSFRYYTDAAYQKYVPRIETRFQVSRLVTYMPTTWHEENNLPYVCCNLIAIKDGPRQGGRLLV